MTPVTAPAPATETQPTRDATTAPQPIQKVAIIVSKGTLDMAYPGLVLANAARMTGIEATLFFTFWGLDVVRKDRIDNLHVATVGNPSMHIPTMLGGLPGMEGLATKMMRKEMDRLDIPPVRELMEILDAAGAEIYGCQMAMDMNHLERDDLIDEVDDVISAMDFYDKAAGAQVIFI